AGAVTPGFAGRQARVALAVPEAGSRPRVADRADDRVVTPEAPLRVPLAAAVHPRAGWSANCPEPAAQLGAASADPGGVCGHISTVARQSVDARMSGSW